ncbi:hypothetical protein G5T42_09905 [Microbacterium sp. 4R-513]|uniref:hypothetical protein n=1 Tax=Microbacterium sp. 4R-513 TaxID=2567934 RepID=UPI0013E1645C|nr:hypothetical protein [Microbacterium sp. 4R-513]QIG39760.1 hypothetical protein G5T42_09905 [Microbacterium sp. 4R-513]
MDERRMWWWTLMGSTVALVSGALLLMAAILSGRLSLMDFMAGAIVVAAVFGVVVAVGGLRRTRPSRRSRGDVSGS